ncbi:NAD(P)-dependent oxidoreductase [Streptosporangium sp. CA-135522]|uniref:NAD(P)-dependent oxidoreductase n=1 Tax=Streptosporangium sp. CA-135522 TaxID=3240072 RepID=UPI003D8BFD97
MKETTTPSRRVLVLDSAPDRFVHDELTPLLAAGTEVTLNLWRLEGRGSVTEAYGGRVNFIDLNGFDEAEVIAAVISGGVGYDVIKSRANVPISATLIQAATDPALMHRLSVIGQVGAGTNNIDLQAARVCGVTVTHTPGANATAVAEHALAMILTITKNIIRSNAAAHRGQWRDSPMVFPAELADLTLGIVGPGRIGTVLARKAQALGMRVVATGSPRFTRAKAESAGMEFIDSLDVLLGTSDVVSLHCPLNDATSGMIGRRELNLMRPGSVLVNMSRGGVVDEDALAFALKDPLTPPAAAAVDVFDREHDGFSSPLMGLANAVLTPHVAGMTDAAILRATVRLSENIVALLEGRGQDVPMAGTSSSA